MKVFEFKQIESGSNFRIEIDYHHYMQKHEVWEKYEEWLEEVIKDGTEPEVKEFQKREKEKAAAEELEYAKEVVSLAESQKIWIGSVRKEGMILITAKAKRMLLNVESLYCII